MRDNNWKQQEAAAATRQKVFEAVADFIDENGYSPTRPELAAKMGLGLNTVRRHLEALITEGRLGDGKGHRTLHIKE